MSWPTEIVMPADNAANPFTIPGTTRTYSCAAGSVITVPGEDALMLRSQGWVGAAHALIIGTGPTSARPKYLFQGQAYMDTTLGRIVLYGGPKTGWLNYFTGAPS
jgi:hypothetical protein